MAERTVLVEQVKPIEVEKVIADTGAVTYLPTVTQDLRKAQQTVINFMDFHPDIPRKLLPQFMFTGVSAAMGNKGSALSASEAVHAEAQQLGLIQQRRASS